MILCNLVILLQNCKHYDKQFYTWTAKHCKQTANYPKHFFFNKVSLLTQNEANMQHLQWLYNCQVIGAIKTTNLWVPKINVHFSLHTLVRGSFKILNVCMALKNHEHLHMKQADYLFCIWDAYLYQKSSDLIMQKDSLWFRYKTNFQIIFRSKRWKDTTVISGNRYTYST